MAKNIKKDEGAFVNCPSHNGRQPTWSLLTNFQDRVPAATRSRDEITSLYHHQKKPTLDPKQLFLKSDLWATKEQSQWFSKSQQEGVLINLGLEKVCDNVGQFCVGF